MKVKIEFETDDQSLIRHYLSLFKIENLEIKEEKAK